MSYFRFALFSVSIQTEDSESLVNKNVDTHHTQKVRQQHLQAVCRNSKLDNKSLYPMVKERLYVDDARRFIWCDVPKAASTTWRKVLELSLYTKALNQKTLNLSIKA